MVSQVRKSRNPKSTCMLSHGSPTPLADRHGKAGDHPEPNGQKACKAPGRLPPLVSATAAALGLTTSISGTAVFPAREDFLLFGVKLHRYARKSKCVGSSHLASHMDGRRSSLSNSHSDEPTTPWFQGCPDGIAAAWPVVARLGRVRCRSPFPPLRDHLLRVRCGLVPISDIRHGDP
jgi:hypothetical protein